MKAFKRLAFIALIIVTAACDLYTPFEGAGISWGYFTADMNGSAWNKLYKNAFQSVYAHISENTDSLCPGKTGSMVSNSHDSNGVRQQELIFLHLPLTTGKYKLTSDEVKYCGDNRVHVTLYSQIENDVSGDIFKILPGSDSYLQINSINLSTGEIFGEFNFTMVVFGPKDRSTLPDTLRFTNGRFHTKILKPVKRERHL